MPVMLMRGFSGERCSQLCVYYSAGFHGAANATAACISVAFVEINEDIAVNGSIACIVNLCFDVLL